jgi:hypothetical protein
MWAVGTFAELVGPPVAGALLRKHDGKPDYFECQVFGGVSGLLGAVFLEFPVWSILNKDKRSKERMRRERSE